MKIKNITHVKTNETRTDGHYPMRIGSIVEFYNPLVVGDSVLLSYVTDNQGNPKSGHLATSIVKEYTETDVEIIVKTRNSIYYFEK